MVIAAVIERPLAREFQLDQMERGHGLRYFLNYYYLI